MPAGWHGMRARPSASACQRRPGRFVPRALQPSASGRARHPARRGPVWHAPRPAAPGLVSSAAQALRRACRRRHPLSRPCQPERRPCLSGTPDRPSSPPAPCPARHAGAPPARMLKLQRLAGLGWPLRALPFSPGRSLALAPAPALTRSASLAKSATSGASPCPARTPGLKLNDNAPLALAQRKHHDIAASQAALAVGDNLVAPPQIHDQAKDKGMVESFRFLASPGPLTFRFTCIGSIGVAAPLSDLS